MSWCTAGLQQACKVPRVIDSGLGGRITFGAAAKLGTNLLQCDVQVAGRDGGVRTTHVGPDGEVRPQRSSTPSQAMALSLPEGTLSVIVLILSLVPQIASTKGPDVGCQRFQT